MRQNLNFFKLLALVLALLLSCAVFASCNGNGTGEETSGGDSSAETDPIESMDFSEMDLSSYISLGQYKNVPIEMNEVEYLVSLRELLHEDNAYFSIVTDGVYEPSGGDDVEVIVDDSRTVMQGDIINVDYTGYLNGVKFDGGHATDQDITVFENGTYIDGFALGFVGTAVGDSSSFNVTFPESYGTESLAGKEVTFEFTVNYIYEFDALTAEIVKDLSDGEYETVEEYEAYQRGLAVQTYLWQKVVDNATVIEYPDQQVQYYFQQNKSFYEYYAAYSSMTYEAFLAYMNVTEADLYENAKEYTKEDLVHYAILHAENITLTDEEFNDRVDVYIKRYMDQFKYTEEEIREKLMDDIRENMLYDKLQEQLIAWANVTWEYPDGFEQPDTDEGAGDESEGTSGDESEDTSGEESDSGSESDSESEEASSSESDGESSEEPGESVESMDFSEVDLAEYITLGAYKNVPLTFREVEYTIALHAAMLSENAHFSSVTADRTVAEGDIINVDYTGYLDGTAFEGGAASDQNITVFENGLYINGFASGFIGATVGESSSFDVTFPENYGSEELAGKKVTFEFTVNSVYAFDALTDEIAAALSGGTHATAAEYETYQRNLLIQAELWKTVVDNATVIEYPEQQVQYYYQQNKSFYETYADYYGMTYEALLETVGLTDADLYDSAKLYVKEDLVHFAIIRAENIAVTDEEYNEKLDGYITLYMNNYGYTEAEVREKMLDAIKENMLYDKLQETLIEWADVSWE